LADLPRLGISLGDPTGIGPEVVVRALAARPGCEVAVFGDQGVLARAAGIRQIRADVLPENQPMLRLLRSSGLVEATAHDEDAVHLTLNLAPARSAP